MVITLTLTHSLTHSLIHSLTHSFTHSLTHSLTHCFSTESSPWSPPTNSSLSLKKYSSPYHHLPGSYMLSYSVSNRDRGRVHLSGSPYPSLVSYIVESVNSEGESAYYWMVREREREREKYLNSTHCVGG